MAKRSKEEREANSRERRQKTNKLFSKISAYSTIVQQNVGKYLNKLSPYAREYESSLDLILTILEALGVTKEWVKREILQMIIGDANIAAIVENGYHGALNSLESRLSLIENNTDAGWLAGIEDAVKITISTILTSLLTCSVSPFIPYKSLDKTYKRDATKGPEYVYPINIPTKVLDISNTLHVSPVSESGIYFYNTGTISKFYRRDAGTEQTTGGTTGGSTTSQEKTVADVVDSGAKKKIAYHYYKLSDTDYLALGEKERKSFKKVVSVPSEVVLDADEAPPREFIYIVRPNLTAESLYKTDDMNAFIWYVINRGDNYDDSGQEEEMGANAMYEYNKMAWDSRRINARKRDDARGSQEGDWEAWLKSRTSMDFQRDDGFLKLEREGEKVKSLYPILQMEPSELYGHLEHIIVTFPAQRYFYQANLDVNVGIGSNTINAPVKGSVTSVIYHFNADYLRSIKIFNWKTIIMNMLYELNGISPIPDVQYDISLSDQIIDAKLSTLILNTIMVDDKEINDNFYSFSNEDYIEALKQTQLKKYGAKLYETAGSSAIQNQSGSPLDIMNSVSTAATLNEIESTISRGVYSVAGDAGSTGITKTELSFNLAFESNFLYQLLFAIVRPLVRAIMSPQIMLLFCINLDVMGLIDLKNIGKKDYSLVSDFIFKKIAAIIKKLIVQIKDFIVRYLLDFIKKEIKKLIDQVAIIMLLEQLNDYISLLIQIIECIRKFSIGVTVSGIDEVMYADIIPEETAPKNQDDL